MLKAVLFDFGGVITTSPFERFATYEQANGLPPDLIRRINATNPDTNAWAQLERRAVDPEGFCALFEAEARTHGFEVSGSAVLQCLSTEVRPFMVEALVRIHETFLTAMLTNNFAPLEAANEAANEAPNGSSWEVRAAGTDGAASRGVSSGASFTEIAQHFDHIIESAVVGVRKPDPEIYRLACATLGLTADEIVFLDDLGVNLKPARAMGMSTIKVVDPYVALGELQAMLGIGLLPA